MKTINLSLYSNKIHFPVTQALPTEISTNFFKELWNFVTFRRKFKVREDYCLYIPSLDIWIFVPAYFIFDGASVPKILNGLYSPTGMLLLGALPHDFGYRYKGLFHVISGRLKFVPYTKNELDSLFQTLCGYESGMTKASAVATFTLGVAGFLGWRENRKRNCNLRIDFPELFVSEDFENEEGQAD
jgi:hypothetical protein